MTACEETLKQREEHIAELQARLDREFALSERLKAQVAGLKAEIESLDASNRNLAPHVQRIAECLLGPTPLRPEWKAEVEKSIRYLKAAFS